MEILLISPKDPKIPTDLKYLMGGENTYTNNLLKYPAGGVVYTHYTEALKKGYIEYTKWQTILSWFMKLRILPIDSGSQCIRLKKKFDIIHCHAYNLKLDGHIKPPVILGDSSSNYLFLRDYLGFSPIRIKAQYVLRKYLHKIIDVYDRDLNLKKCISLIVFSEFAKKVHINLGGEEEKITVVYPGLPRRKIKRRKDKKYINILFAGVWFERKGGLLLLEAYKILKKKYSHLKLTILGPLPKGIFLEDLDIIQLDYVSYDRLFSEFYAKADIFVLVPPLAEGFGMVILEAMSLGIPVIVSSVYALPELVKHTETGFIVKQNSLKALTNCLETFINNSKLRKKMGDGARKRFLEKFSIEATNKNLLNVYKKALAYSTSTKSTR